MMLFQYLVNALEADFVPRHVAYKGKLLANLAVYLVVPFICLHSEKDVLSIFLLCYRVTRLGDFQRVSVKYASGTIYINKKMH